MIATMRVFENACCRFFQHKSIGEADHVKSVIYNFESSSVQSWVNVNHAHLVKMTFTQFILEFKHKFLPCNWQDDLVSTQIGMQGMKPFLSWMECVHEANAELGIAKSDYHIAEDKLHAHFIPRLSPALKTSYDANNTHLNLDKIAELDTWIERVHLLDVELENKHAEWLKLAISTGQANAKSWGVLRNSNLINSGASETGLNNSTCNGPAQPVQLFLYMKLGDLPNKAHASSWLTAQIGSCPRLSDIYYYKI
jgi:hypothetical protein